MSLEEEQIWQSRFNTLSQIIISTYNSFDEQPKEQWEVVIKGTLNRLLGFSKKQFDFFNNGFKSEQLIDSTNYKAEYALRRTLDQIAYDLEVLQRARNQRLSSSAQERNALALADKVGYEALKPAIKGNILGKTAVITYFQKTADVRVVPYAPVALIGIPYSCVDFENNARDFLAIPHEIGHYVFQHAKHPTNNIRLKALLHSIITEEPNWRNAWLEEIFADVYGAIVAGPAIALDFQEYLFDNLDLTDDDGVHPVSAIRPDIYTHTLSKLKGTEKPRLFLKSPSVLNDNWDDIIKNKRGFPKEFVPHPKHKDHHPVPFHVAKPKVNQLVADLLKLLDPILPANTGVPVWTNDTDTPDTNLYAEFFKDFLIPLLEKVDEQELPSIWREKSTAKVNMMKETAGNKAKEDEGALLKWFDVFNVAQQQGLSLLPSTWNTLLNGTGWAVGGPEDDGNSKG